MGVIAFRDPFKKVGALPDGIEPILDLGILRNNCVSISCSSLYFANLISLS